MLAEALGLGDDVAMNPSGGALVANPVMVDRPRAHRRGFRQVHDRRQAAGARSRVVGPVPATEPRVRRGRTRLMAERCAVVGIGMTKMAKCRDDVSMAGLVREAAIRALADAEMTWNDIDAVVIGTAPDIFEGVMMPELYLADALGAAGKPIMRVHTAGSVGGSTAVVATHLIESGCTTACSRVAFEKQSRRRHQLRVLERPQRGCRRRWLLRAAHPRVHRPFGRARLRRPDGRGEGPQERAEEPVRALAAHGHQHRDGAGVADGVGPDPPPRVVPDLRRRVRDGADQRSGWQSRDRSRPRGCTAPRCAPSSVGSPVAIR